MPMIEKTRDYVAVLRQQATQLNELADTLEKDLGSAARPIKRASAPKVSPVELVPVAQAMFSLRRRREKILPQKFLGEPMWDLLLHLFERTANDHPVSITKASYAAHVPPTTALRAISVMENEGYLVRTKPCANSRNVQLRLTDNAMEAMCSYLQSSDPPRLYTEALVHRIGGVGVA
ncbi:MAG: DNA-binding MarR family transcriptional regulator [Devosia litorisediminis]|jgi:hypothetical protein